MEPVSMIQQYAGVCTHMFVMCIWRISSYVGKVQVCTDEKLGPTLVVGPDVIGHLDVGGRVGEDSAAHLTLQNSGKDRSRHQFHVSCCVGEAAHLLVDM